MRRACISLLAVCILLPACKAASNSANPLLGTWVSTDRGCPTKEVFEEQYFTESWPAVGPNPAYSNTSPAHYSVANPKLVFVQGTTTVTDSWQLTDATHAISGATSGCHFTKQ
ncbi:MAG: hypothetical protein ISP90_08420 [Nevskia sp.]|nr:hypothetical protein [Nevskia sp.]